MSKNLFNLILIAVILFSNALFLEVNAIKIVSEEQQVEQEKEITLADMFNYFGKLYDSKIPDTYKYIDLKITGIDKNDELYANLQKLVYVDIIKNNPVKLNRYKKINAYNFYSFVEKNYNIKLVKDEDISEYKIRKAIFKDFENIDIQINLIKNSFKLDSNSFILNDKKVIFEDVYSTLTKNHYLRDELNKNEMIINATKALAEGTGDKYTVYFPPVDNKTFNEALTGEYQGIGAYVDMEKPGEFKIVSPIPGSPAESSGLKGGDIVIKVDEFEILDTHSVGEIVSRIKGPAGTEVVLTINRNDDIFEITVIRDKIIIKEVVSKKINSSTLYIQMKFFGPHISKEFGESLEILKTDKNIKKIIFDLRGNGGGYLGEVSNVLSYFVPKMEPTAKVKYYNSTQNYYSRGFNDIDFSEYKLITLQNGGTASASEIFIGTLKDYFPETTIIGEQSYGKGSVQTIKSYRDGSSLKYTIAKWYTGKNEIGIDGIGITPDILLKMEKYGVDEKEDIQLQKAIRLR